MGSDANVARFNAGLTYGLTPRTSIITSLGIGLIPDAPDLALSVKIPYTF